MATIKQLRKQNERLRNSQKKLDELQKLQEERARLIKENRQLTVRTKYPRAAATSKRIVEQTGKAGVKLWSGLNKWGQRLAEAQKKEQMRNRKLKRVVKKTPMKRKAAIRRKRR